MLVAWSPRRLYISLQVVRQRGDDIVAQAHRNDARPAVLSPELPGLRHLRGDHVRVLGDVAREEHYQQIGRRELLLDARRPFLARLDVRDGEKDAVPRLLETLA